MTDKTARQQAEMRKQTIGVEIEMNNITREIAAEIAAEYFGTGRSQYMGNARGYCTWSAWDAQGREWAFKKDSSIRGNADKKCELVTPILHYEDIELLQGLVRKLRRAGAKSDASQGCGVHIHIGAKGHTARTLRNLVNIMASHEELLRDALMLDNDRVWNYCKMVDPIFLKEVNEKKPEEMWQLADIWYSTQTSRCESRHIHYNSSRYHMLNLHATFEHGTIEFRLFQFDEARGGRLGGLHAGQLKAYIQLCLALSQAAKDQKKASSKPMQKDNQKFAMRTWLMRMGMIGPEFETAREMLTRNLSGDAAFRNGRD